MQVVGKIEVFRLDRESVYDAAGGVREFLDVYDLDCF